MQDHQQHLIRHPFENTVDTSFFFAGGTRREIVDEIKSALLDGISLITLIGPEGSGKTMICRMVEKELPAGMVSVFLPQAVVSFNDMVDIVGREVIKAPEDYSRATTEELLQAIADSLRRNGLRLVIVFEEAEKIYLATLERIRKMLDRVNSDGLLLHLLLSGQPALTESLEQLGIVAFQEIEERNLILDDLDQEATQAYLNHSLSIVSGGQDAMVPPDIGAGIFSASLGNFRKINQLAAEYLQSEQKGEPFLVLLDALNASNGQRANSRARRSRTTPGMPKVNLDFLALPKIDAKWLWAGGGLTVVTVLLLLLFARSPEEPGLPPDQSEVPVIELRTVEPLADEAEPVLTESERQIDTPDVAVRTAGPDAEKTEQMSANTQQTDSLPEIEPPPDSEPSVENNIDSGAADLATVVPVRPAQPSSVESPESSGKTVPNAAARIGVGEDEPRETAVAQEIEEPSATTAGVSPAPAAAPEAAAESPVIAATATKKVMKPAPVTDRDQERQAGVPEAVEKKSEESEAERSREIQSVGDNEAEIDIAEQAIVKSPTERKEAVQPLPVTIFKEARNEVASVSPPPQGDLGQGGETAESAPSPDPEQAQQEPTQTAAVEQRPTEPARFPSIEAPPSVPSIVVRDSLYKERLAAGARWLVGGGSGRFTVQLMVLTSDQAEENLQQMLEDKDYRSVADNLFVLRRLGDPPTVMLYFGEYRTLAAAQKARNTLPVFLRKHDPYPIAVNAAVEKTRMLP
jgi:type II secretory pathway predicted ATPase ExeA